MRLGTPDLAFQCVSCFILCSFSYIGGLQYHELPTGKVKGKASFSVLKLYCWKGRPYFRGKSRPEKLKYLGQYHTMRRKYSQLAFNSNPRVRLDSHIPLLLGFLCAALCTRPYKLLSFSDDLSAFFLCKIGTPIACFWTQYLGIQPYCYDMWNTQF